MKVKLSIPEQETIVETGKEFQIKGNIKVIGTVCMLLYAIAQSELFVICQEHFSDNKKHWIENETTFAKLGKMYGFGWEDIPKAISLAEVNQHKTGDTILWEEALQEFIVGEKARDIYFPVIVGDMKAVWSNLVKLLWISDAGFNTQISFNFWYRPQEEQRRNLDEGTIYKIKVIPVLHHILIRENDLPKAVALVKQWKNHPAWGGTVMLDEPQLNKISVADQKRFYDAIKEADPEHTHYTAFFPDPMKPEYYDTETFDIAILNYYPVRTHGDWREYIRTHLDTWLNSTGDRDIIPNMQAFEGRGEFANPIGTLEEQFGFWKERKMTARGYSVYAESNGAGSGSSGIRELPGMLEEVIKFNSSK